MIISSSQGISYFLLYHSFYKRLNLESSTATCIYMIVIFSGNICNTHYLHGIKAYQDLVFKISLITFC